MLWLTVSLLGDLSVLMGETVFSEEFSNWDIAASQRPLSSLPYWDCHSFFSVAKGVVIQFYIRTAKLPPVWFAHYFSYKIITLGILSKILSLTGLNYLLLAIEVSFQCGASEIKISKLKKKKRKDTWSFILKK